MSQITTHETAVHFTDENFNAEVIKSPVPTLVDFWAEWCSPCKIVGPYRGESWPGNMPERSRSES